VTESSERNFPSSGSLVLAIEGVTGFEAQCYGKSLERMNEPWLPKVAQDANAEVYRLMILPTWGNSMVVRVHKHGRLFVNRLTDLMGRQDMTRQIGRVEGH
jgi:hypothetical protein